MLRTFVCSLFALAIVTVGLLAAEIKGKVKSVSDDQKTIIVTVDDKDQTFSITDDTKVVSAKGKDVKDRTKALQNLKAGAEVTVTTEKKGGKEVVVELKMPAGKKKQ